MTTSLAPTAEVSDRYLDLLKKCLTRYLFIDGEVRPIKGDRWSPPFERLSTVLAGVPPVVSLGCFRCVVPPAELWWSLPSSS